MNELESYRSVLESWGVNQHELETRLARPKLDTPSTRAFWDDPHISSQMMAFHLDPHLEAASKRHPTIDAECAYLAKALDLKSGKTLVDLGCGPGLYLERWVNTGASLVGVDLSPLAIATARQRLSAPIRWINADYRHLPTDVMADVMTLIYYDFTALPVHEQIPLLQTLVKHLNPGGCLALDVMTPNQTVSESVSVKLRLGGFWSATQHLEIHQVFIHEAPLVIIDQYTLVDPQAHIESIRIQNRLLTKEELEAMLKAAGLTPVHWYSDLSGTPFDQNSKTLAVIATKSHSGH